MLVKRQEFCTGEELQREFDRYGRGNQFSIYGLDAIAEFYNEGDEEELDVIGICCDFTEDTPSNIQAEYNNIEDIAHCNFTDELYKAFSHHTYVAELDNGNWLYLNF